MSTLNEQDRANLAAYLDGELDAPTSQALEEKINLDPEARKEVDALKRTWGMLDFLPKPSPSAGFTHRTLDRLSLEKMGGRLRRGQNHRFALWIRSIMWVAGILVTTGIGFAVGHLLAPNHPEKIVAVQVQQPPPSPVPPTPPKPGPVSDLEWMKNQPKALRDQYEGLAGAAKSALVAKLRLEEQARHQEWLIASRFWSQLDKGLPLPARLTDFAQDVQTFVNEYLRPTLSRDEESRLAKASGQWPLYPLLLVELADKHPPALPGDKGPKTFAELPTEVKNKFKNKAGTVSPKLLKAEGHWPGFAIMLTTIASGKKGNYVLPHELWPTSRNGLSAQMQEFMDQKLAKVLDAEDRLRLNSVDGKWPDYPVAIAGIAANIISRCRGTRCRARVNDGTITGCRRGTDNDSGQAT